MSQTIVREEVTSLQHNPIKILAIRKTPEHNQASHFIDVAYNGLYLREVQVRPDRSGKVQLFFPAVHKQVNGVRVAVAAFNFIDQAAKREFTTAVRQALSEALPEGIS